MAGKYGRKKTEVAKHIWNYNYMVYGQRGVGKTTLFLTMFSKLVGVDGCCLISIGKEQYPEHVKNFWVVKAETYEDFLDIIDDFYNNKEDYPDLKMIGIDSFDELVRLGKQYIVDEYNKDKDINQRVETIKATHGGYQTGENMLIDSLVDNIFKVNNVGVGSFIIGHSKQKTKTDQMGDGVEYDIVSLDVSSQFADPVLNKVQVCGCAHFERVMAGVELVKDAYHKGKMKKVGHIEEEKRMISFIDDGFSCDVKSHLTRIQPKCELDPDVIIDVLNDAIKKQDELWDDWFKNNIGEVKEVSSVVTEEKVKKTSKSKSETKKDDEEMRQKMIAAIKDNIAKIDETKCDEITDKYSIENIEEAPMEALKEILALIPA